MLPKTVWTIALRDADKTLHLTDGDFEDCSEGKGTPLTASSFVEAVSMHEIKAGGRGVIREMPYEWLMGLAD